MRAHDPVLHRRSVAAIKRARELSGWKFEHWAEALGVSLEVLQGIEDGRIPFDADFLLLAAAISEQPMATIMGETEIYAVTLPEIERQLDRLREPQELILGPQFYR